MSYSPGAVRAICDRCGFEYRLSELRKEWTGLMVCASDYDRKPPELSAPKVKPEGVPKRNARPDNQVDNTPNTTTRENL